MSIFGIILVRIFPQFGLNAERYGVSLRIQSEMGKSGPEYLQIRPFFTQCSFLKNVLSFSYFFRNMRKNQISCQKYFLTRNHLCKNVGFYLWCQSSAHIPQRFPQNWTIWIIFENSVFLFLLLLPCRSWKKLHVCRLVWSTNF